MEKEKIVIISVSIPLHLKEKAIRNAKKLLGTANVSGYLTYLVNKDKEHEQTID